MTYRNILIEGEKELANAGVPDTKVDAWELLAKACDIDRKKYLMISEDEIPDDKIQVYRDLIALRKTRKPLQQILGFTEFMGLRFEVNDQVLVPRQDTELLVEQTLKHLSPGMSVLDLCTGSGCILISLMHFCREIKGLGVDISETALEVARRNARANLVHPRWLKGDLFGAVLGDEFDIIVSNPPYIPSHVIAGLMPEVRDYEPHKALDGGKDGLDYYRRIIDKAPDYLKPGGVLLFEIGVDEKLSVETLMFDRGFSDIRCVRDYAGNDRVIMGKWS